jgi:hypothetical protein
MAAPPAASSRVQGTTTPTRGVSSLSLPASLVMSQVPALEVTV